MYKVFDNINVGDALPIKDLKELKVWKTRFEYWRKKLDRKDDRWDWHTREEKQPDGSYRLYVHESREAARGISYDTTMPQIIRAS
jgi:hypothetical protein